ncbi:MAG: sigma-70 family RNA polymerase sigma factor [Acidobacteria bacterium]|jgi:RNA polymerase sigma factor (sigma-70 family)|nr:sigma-70 family RNA polymerase sigma factor [Acidobacteriota bacterium]
MRKELTVLNGDETGNSFPGEYYQNIINANFQYIEKQCFKAVRLKLNDNISPGNTLNIENEALELSNRVLDILQRNNYHALREFKGNAQLTTYISAIISRQAVDLIRKKLGRDREKDRAKEFGNTGLILYQRVIKDGYSLQEVFTEFRGREGYPVSLEELETMFRKIKGKNPGNDCNESPVVKIGTSITGEEYVIPDSQNDPQTIFMENQRNREIDGVIQGIITQLSGEERLLLRMRFPYGEDEKPKPVEQIASALGITSKAVYKRIARLIKKCRAQLDHQGITINELL